MTHGSAVLKELDSALHVSKKATIIPDKSRMKTKSYFLWNQKLRVLGSCEWNLEVAQCIV